MEVEYEVQLADVAKVAVEALDEVVDRLEDEQLVVGGVGAAHKVEGGVALVALFFGWVFL